MGKAYAMVRPTLTLSDIMDIRGRDDVRLTTSPFGLTPEQYEKNPPIYLSRAVPWKHHKENMPPKVKAGLDNAIKISKACANIKGTIIWNGKLYPRKCIAQKKEAGKISSF